MANYDFLNGKKRILDILNSTNETQQSDTLPVESAFSYDNGYYGYVSSIFVDICKSTELFDSSDIRKTTKAKMIRSFTSEVIEILRQADNLRDIGIRGDCVFAIYTTPAYSDDYEVFSKAVYINTFGKMLNALLEKKNFQKLRFGIGISTGYDLVVKAGRSGTGINDLVWIGKAVTYASKFSNLANRNGNEPIFMTDGFYNNLVKAIEKSNKNNTNLNWFRNFCCEGYFGKQCDVIKTNMDKWINSGMPDNWAD